MTTEDDFQRRLDECPEDYQTRLIFADWLDEQGDERAAGYRAMGVMGLRPWKKTHHASWYDAGVRPGDKNDPQSNLPQSWFMAVDGDKLGGWMRWDSRREAEDSAALAFARLSAEYCAELLNPTVPA